MLKMRICIQRNQNSQNTHVPNPNRSTAGSISTSRLCPEVQVTSTCTEYLVVLWCLAIVLDTRYFSNCFRRSSRSLMRLSTSSYSASIITRSISAVPFTAVPFPRDPVYKSNEYQVLYKPF